MRDFLNPACSGCERTVCRIGAAGCLLTDRSAYYAECYRRNREKKLAAAKERQRRLYVPKPRKKRSVIVREAAG